MNTTQIYKQKEGVREPPTDSLKFSMPVIKGGAKTLRAWSSLI